MRNTGSSPLPTRPWSQFLIVQPLSEYRYSWWGGIKGYKLLWKKKYEASIFSHSFIYFRKYLLSIYYVVWGQKWNKTWLLLQKIYSLARSTEGKCLWLPMWLGAQGGKQRQNRKPEKMTACTMQKSCNETSHRAWQGNVVVRTTKISSIIHLKKRWDANWKRFQSFICVKCINISLPTALHLEEDVCL